MLTLCTLPKPFHGHIGIIQNNAIRSWTLLRPECEIILFGNEEGTADIAAELGLRHVPDIECNEYGTPLRNSLLEAADNAATHDILCHVNTDIILLSDFTGAVEHAIRHVGEGQFLLIGRRWNIDLKENWDFNSPNWEARLRAYAAKVCQQRSAAGLDYMVFPRGMYRNVPPFAIGRFSDANWLIHNARSQGILLIEATQAITAFHQGHNYAHQKSLPQEESTRADNRNPEGAYGILINSQEAKRNVELAGGQNPFVSPLDATYVLARDGSLKRLPVIGRLYRRLCMLRLPFPLSKVRPFRAPLKIMIPLVRAFRSVRAKQRRPFD